MTNNFKVSGLGCCLVDRVYNKISFTAEGFEKYLSLTPGDGGLIPGNLVFREEFEDFSGLELNQFIRSVSGDKKPGEKHRMISPYYEKYQTQLNESRF
jgi:hypothetical protein